LTPDDETERFSCFALVVIELVTRALHGVSR
jgi:hypothetical protein